MENIEALAYLINKGQMPKDHIKRTTVVTVASGTAASSSREPVVNGKNDDKYQKVWGVLVQVRSNGGDPNFRIGIEKDKLAVDDPHHNANWIGGSNAAPKERVYPISFQMYGSRVDVVTENVATLTADLVYEVTFILVKPEDCK